MNRYESEYSAPHDSQIYSTDNASETSSTDDKKKIMHFYYRGNQTDSLITDVSEPNYSGHNVQLKTHTTQYHTPTATQHNNADTKLNCGICKTQNKGSFIVLSCNHVFHVACLAETHFTDVYNYAVIDSDYFSTRKCQCCGNRLQTEELMFLHSKFLSSTKDRLESHQNAVVGLEERMNKLKEELKVCYEYKHKLECDREKSKQIVSTLLTMLP